MPTWPSTLKVTRSGFKETPAKNMIRSDMDTGPAKVRRRSTANVRPATVMLFLTDDQLQTLDDFFVNDCASGALSFDFINPRTNSTVQARFVEEPEYPQADAYWNVSLSLEFLP